MWMFYLAILLHGVCFDFFFMTGQLIRRSGGAAAPPRHCPGLLHVRDVRLGMFVGSMLSGAAVDFFTHTAPGGEVTRNWNGFWLTSGLSALAILILVALFFRDKTKIQPQPALKP